MTEKHRTLEKLMEKIIRKRWKKKQLLRNKRSSRGEQDRKNETRDNLAKEEILQDDRFFFIAGHTS